MQSINNNGLGIEPCGTPHVTSMCEEFSLKKLTYIHDIHTYNDIHTNMEHIGLVVRMSILDTEVDGSNPNISMFFP